MNERTRSASLGREKKKSDLKPRYWAFLFKNLQLAVDELYKTCETDESISECKEVILVLENYTREFHNLTEWFRMEKEYENTPIPQRPNSLAWEIRKSSPGKIFRQNYQPSLNGVVCRKLLYELSKNSAASAKEVECLPTKQINEDEDKSNTACSNIECVSLKKDECKNDNAARLEGRTLEKQTMSSVEETTAKNRQSTSADRKTIVIAASSSSSSYPKKITRSPSVTNVCETNSSSTTKRLPSCVSPKKTVPGRNVGAPIFYPRDKLRANNFGSVASKMAENVSISDDSVSAKTKIPRSQSDPILGTGVNDTQRPVSADVDDKVSVNDAIVSPSSSTRSVHSLSLSLHVIDERTSQYNDLDLDLDCLGQVENGDAIRAKSKEADSPDAGLTRSCTKSTLLIAKPTPKTSLNRIATAKAKTTTDALKKNTNTVAVKSQRSDCNSRFGGVCGAGTGTGTLERRTVTTSSKPKAPLAVKSRTQFHQNDSEISNNNNSKTDNENKRTTIATGTMASVVEKSSKIVARVPSEGKGTRNVEPKKATANVFGGDKCRSSKPRNNNYSTSLAKSTWNSNSFQSSTKSSGDVGRLNTRNVVRSKTSIDLKSTGANTLKKAPQVENGNVRNHADDCSPRHRRSSKDTDGWEMVIGKSRRSIPNSFNVKNKLFDVNNRFHEPSSSTSLPILVLENEGVDKTVQQQQQQQQQQFRQYNVDGVKSKSALEMKINNKNRNRYNSHGSCNGGGGGGGGGGGNGNRDSFDTTVEVEKGESSEKMAGQVDYDDYKLQKERPIITAMFSAVQPKRKKSNEKDGRRTKGSGKENKNKFGGNAIVVASEKLCVADERGNDHLLDEEESLRKSKELYEKEISLQKEINELQNDADLEMDADADTDADLDVDMDSDSTELDQEIVDLYNDIDNDITNTDKRRAALEVTYEHVLTNMSWAERTVTLDKLEELLVRDPSGRCLKFAKSFTCLEQFEDLVSRAPGRALELHQKLSSPSRKRISPDTTILQHKARQAKAKRNREQLMQDKSAKIRELFNKVAEVKAMQTQLANDRVERKKLLEQKLKRAEENRNLYLRNRQEKAHDEAKKQREIAFINELEAQNKRHEFYALLQEQEDRFKSILEDRQRRQEEKAAREAAVEGRRKAIEAERQEKIEELQEKMRKREERIDRELQEKERERIKVAREKARDREDRLLALQAAQIANVEELQKKIQQKQESSARRHEENIELKRQKAIEIGTPRLTPYQVNKLCSVCNVVIDSEVFLLSHLKGRSHQEAVKKYREQFEASVKFNECSIITEAPADVLLKKRSREKERQNTLRKRCKKIRHRLSNRSEEYLKSTTTRKDACKKVDSANKGRILKSIKEVEKLFSSQGNGIWPNNAVTILERNLFEIIRILEKCCADDQRIFKEYDGFAMLSKVYNLALDLPKNMSPYLPLKCFIVATNLFASACDRNIENCLFVLLSNNLIQIIDFLLNRLNLIMPNGDDRNGMVVYKADTVADVLMNVCSSVLSIITSLTLKDDDSQESDSRGGDGDYDLQMISAHLCDVVSYVVCTGIVDKLAVYCSSVHDNKSADSYFLLHCMELLTQLVETRRGNITNKEDCTQLMVTLKATELVGAVSMLYAMLLHQDSMSNDNSSSQAVLRPDVVNVIIATLRLFSKVAELNLKFFQNILAAEGISLQVRHIISYLLRYCLQNDCCKHLLHQVIEFIGFFAVHHTDNQLILQSGSTPTVLQQLSNLPFAYFSNPLLVRILFPTLLACCVGNPQNRTILDQEVSYQLLQDFQNAQDSKNIPLIKLLRTNR